MNIARLLLSSAVAAGALLLTAARAEAAPTYTTPTWCRDTNDPGVVLEGDDAQLVWDVFGNLTLVNHTGTGSKTTWGIDSPTPLTNAPAKLCYKSGGNLSIEDAAGNLVWKSAQSITADNWLALTGCQVRSWSGYTNIKWSEQTPACDRRRMPKPTADRCWTDGDILWNIEEDYGLRFASGRLSFHRKGEEVWNSGSTGAGRRVCYQADGNLVVYTNAGGVVWASGSNTPSNTMMTMDRCGVSFSDSPNPRDQHKRVNAWTCDVDTVTEGWRRTIGAAGTLIANDSVRLDWNADGHLKLWSASGSLLWTSPNSKAGHHLEFQGDGNLVIYSSSNAPLWAYNQENGGRLPPSGHTAALTLKDCGVSVIDQEMLEFCEAPGTGSKPFDPSNFTLTQAEAMLCNYESSWRIWTKTPATCLAAIAGGGFAFARDERTGDARFGAETWIGAAAVNAAGIDDLRAFVAPYDHVKDTVEADLPTGTPPSDFREVLATAGAGATLFSQSFTVVEVNAYVGMSQGPKDGFTFSALGFDVIDEHETGIFNPKAEATFFERDQTFMLGFIPVNVTASVEGTVGLHFNAWNDNGTLKSTVEPYVSLDLAGSVGVGVSGASAGIDTSLQLARLGVPLSLDIGTSNGAYRATGDIELSTLSGEVELYAKLLSFKAKKKLVSWDGYSTSARLFDIPGTL